MFSTLQQLAPVIVPSVSVLLALIGYFDKRSPAKKILARANMMLELRGKLPEAMRKPIDDELIEHLKAARSELHYLRVRRLSVSIIAVIVFVAILAGLSLWFAMGLNTWWSWLVGLPAFVFFVLLELAGIGQTWQVPAGDTISPDRAHREKAKDPTKKTP